MWKLARLQHLIDNGGLETVEPDDDDLSASAHAGSVARQRLEKAPATRWEKSLAAATSLRQNMRTKPAIAAKADATGIRESGPIYTALLLLAVVASRGGDPS
jgi:hypothetical protein